MAPPNSFALARSSSPARDWFAGLFFALILARWLVPAEASADGETLWIAFAWFIAGACVCCFSSPLAPAAGERVRERGRAPQPALNFIIPDFAVGLLIAGHVISGIVVVITGGDRRAAVNLVWEWLSLGVFWWLCRTLLSRMEIRRQLVPFVMTTVLTLSVWGLWQHFIWYPQMAAKYGPMLELLKAGKRAPEIIRQLSEAGIPTENPALELFINRLVQSGEPFGPFALANTYGGLLAAFLVIAFFSPLRDASQKRSPATRAASWLSLIPIAIALYLTNSRTAWAGLLAAFAAGGALWIAGKSKSLVIKQWLFPATILAGCLAGFAILSLIVRGEHAVPGPLKSLAYRAEYWIGTKQMLLASPWLGNGLGQFRDRYPAFKVPDSSEEIADPHNLLLDVWANGGLLALAGLFGMIVLLFLRLHQSQSPPSATAGPVAPTPSAWRFAGIAGFLFAIFGPLLTTGVWDASTDRLAIFGVVWFALSWLTPYCFANHVPNGLMVLLAALALCVHLLGAGGIGMPAVTQLLLLLLAWGLPTTSATETRRPNLVAWTSSVACAALAAGCFLIALLPVSISRAELQRGDFAWSRGNSEAAARHFRAAADADFLSAESWLRLAELEFGRRNWDAAAKAIDEAIRRAPDRAPLWQRKGQMLSEAARRSRSRDDWQAAGDAFNAAVSRHPTDALLLADCAEALSRTNSTDATAMARRALAQDDLNHKRGHTDQYLQAQRRRTLERLATP